MVLLLLPPPLWPRSPRWRRLTPLRVVWICSAEEVEEAETTKCKVWNGTIKSVVEKLLRYSYNIELTRVL